MPAEASFERRISLVNYFLVFFASKPIVFSTSTKDETE